MTKVIFLDRDGVINYEPGDYTYQVNLFTILDGVLEALEIWADLGYEFIVITNQGGISKGRYGHKEVNEVHEYMEKVFSENGIVLKDVYYCPHHSNLEQCICRKPDSLMLEKAIARYNVDATNSYFVGDSERDIIAAQKAGVVGVKVEKNDSLMNYVNEIS